MTATATCRAPESSTAASCAVRKILVADDNASSREFLREVLEHMGHQVWEAGDGVEAVETAHRIVPDLVFLDLHMPGLDGFGVLREIRAAAGLSELTVIAITASAMSGDCERARSAGFTRYLTKPVSLQALRSELARCFAQD